MALESTLQDRNKKTGQDREIYQVFHVYFCTDEEDSGQGDFPHKARISLACNGLFNTQTQSQPNETEISHCILLIIFMLSKKASLEIQLGEISNPTANFKVRK